MFNWSSWTLFVVCFLSVDAKTKGGERKLKHYTNEALKNLAYRLFDNGGIRREAEAFMHVRMPDTDGIRKVQKHIVDKFNKLNWDVELDTFEDNTPFGKKTFTNVIATFDPLAPHKLVLACHYDSKNMTFEKKVKRDFIGAIDSAIPCAILVDLAVQLDCLLQKAKGNPKKDTTLQLIFFDGEEAYLHWTDDDSLYGSRHLANKWSTESDKNLVDLKKIQTIELFVLLDLIGSREMRFRDFNLNSFSYFQKLGKIEKQLKKELLNSDGLNKNNLLFTDRMSYGEVQDDHIPFYGKGVPVLHLIPTPFPSVWHEFSDNESAIDYDITDNFIRIMRVFVAGYLQLDALKSGCKNK